MKQAAEAPLAGAEFWRFSLAFYACEGVPRACLQLQDDGGADVNVVLYLLFLAYGGWACDRSAVARIDALVAPWREQVVRPLRGVRRALKTELGVVPAARCAQLRGDLQRIELEAERLQHEALESCGQPASIGAARAREGEQPADHNLRAYAEWRGGLAPQPLAVLRAAFDDYARATEPGKAPA